MRRVTAVPRPNWRQIVARQGLVFHTLDDQATPYWNESAYYALSAQEVDELEQATYELDRMCLAAVEHVLERNLLAQFGIDPRWHTWLCESWQRDERTIVGRFDLVYDGHDPPKMLEYNADTPTSLLEAAVIQWYWLQDLRSANRAISGHLDQFNSLHERLIEAWVSVRDEISREVTFASIAACESVEDYLTVAYLRDTAVQAGLTANQLAVEQIGWSQRLSSFVDLQDRPLSLVFKLYPWEWMLAEEFAAHLPTARTRWLEPPWKMILSNKALLPLLFEMFPDSPYVLKARHEPWNETYVRKPLFSREGAGVSIVRHGTQLAEGSMTDVEGPWIYQAYQPLPEFDGRRAVVGSWMINGHAAGIGIRESRGLITDNKSQFVPHVFY